MFRWRRTTRPGVNIWICFDNTESEPRSQTLQLQVRPRPPCVSLCLKLQVHLFCGETKKSPLSDYLTGFRVCGHTLTCVNETWKRLWVIRDTMLFEKCTHVSWTCVCKEGRNSLVVRLLIGVWHIQTYTNKKGYIHMNLRTHTRNDVRSPEKSAFLDSSHDQCGECFMHVQTHSGFGRVYNMKVCVVVSKSRLWEHILLFNSWPCGCPSCPSSKKKLIPSIYGSLPSSYTSPQVAQVCVTFRNDLNFFL